MKVKPMIGSYELPGIERIESAESRSLVEHGVPGLEGNYLQDMGSVPNTIVIVGTRHGDADRDDFLTAIRELFNSREPTTFVADINTATDVTDVVIEDLQVVEIGGGADSFRYLVKIRKYIEPPEPPATGLLDGGILDDALGLAEILDAIDALGSISNLGDPTVPLRDSLDGVRAATGGLDQTVSALRDLLGEGNGAIGGGAAPGPGPTPGAGGPGSEAGAGAASEPVASAGELQIDPEDPRIDAGARSGLQALLEAPETAEEGARLARGINGGTLAGIAADDSDVVERLAGAHGTDAASLVPSAQDAALVLDAASPLEAPPTIVFRSGVPEDPARLGRALEEVARTFALFEQGELGRCDSTASAIPIPNLVPASFCRVPAAVPSAVLGPTVKFVLLDRYGIDQSSIQSSHLPVIRRIAHLVVDSQAADPIRTIRLVGHTDPSGPASHNISLGRQRAVNVRTGLIAAIERLRPGLVASVNIVVESFGKEQPVASNETPAGQARNRRVEVFVPRTCQAFFAQYDLRFQPTEPDFGVPAHPSMTAKDKADRIKDVGAMASSLRTRTDQRAADALAGKVPSAAPASAKLRLIAIRLSDAQLALYQEYVPDGAGGIDFAAFQGCFERFTNGDLRNPTPAVGEPKGVGEPNSAAHFFFAEFAFLCIDSNIDIALWTKALKVFVKSHEIFMHVYRPAPHPKPPPLDAPLPAPGAALRSLGSFDSKNFKADGQSNADRKKALRAKYAPMDIVALRNAARDTMLRAQRMPPKDAAPGPVEGGIEEGPEVIDPSAPDLQIHHLDPRVDVGAKFALKRMLQRPDMAQDAARLIRGINGETLAGIFGDDRGAAVEVAQAHGTERWLLVPEGQDAALVLNATAPLQAPPTVIFRGDTPDIRDTPARIDPALQAASRTFGLWRRGLLGPCASSASTIPIPNLVPPSFCQLPGRELLVVVTEPGLGPGLPGPVASGARVQVVGPAPSSKLEFKFTDETGRAPFSDLAPGSYTVTASKEGFEDASTQVLIADDEEPTSSFAGGEGLESIGGGKGAVLLQLLTSITPRLIDVRFITGDTQQIPAPTPDDPDRTVTRLVLPVGKTARLRATGTPAGHVYGWDTVTDRIEIVDQFSEMDHPNECVIKGLKPGETVILARYNKAGTTSSRFTPMVIMVVSVGFVGAVDTLDKRPTNDRVAHRTYKVKFEPANFWSGTKAIWSFTPFGNVRGSLPTTKHNTNLEKVSGFDFTLLPAPTPPITSPPNQVKGNSIINASGFVAVRVNMPPIGLNQCRLSVASVNFPQMGKEIESEVLAVVVIDPGHGGLPGQDHGLPCSSSVNNSTGINSSVLEKTLTLEMGLRVRDALSANAMSIHLQILMTRTINVNPSGCDRPHIARDNGADVFLSIHFDGNDSQAIRGPRTYVRKTAHGNTNHVEDSAFAARIQEAVTTLIPHPTINAQVRDHDDELAVLNDDNLGEPPQFHAVRACFAELEFLTNPAADDLFNTSPTADSFKDQLAEAIARAIIDDIDNQP